MKPPHDTAAEESLLGAMLLSRGATTAALDAGVSAATFYKPGHGAVFDAIVKVIASGATADATSVAAALNGDLERIGGRGALARLQASTPASANAPEYARIILGHQRRRAAVVLADELRTAALSGDVDRALDDAVEGARSLVESQHSGTGRRVSLRCAADVQPEAVQFVFERLVPRKAVSLIVGAPGLAKTTLAVHLIAGVTRGTLRGDLSGRPSPAIVWSGEDPFSTVLVPRLRAAGADLDLVHLVTVTHDGLEDGLVLPADVDRLETAQRETGAVILLIDPLMAAIGDNIDAHKDHSMRRAIAPLFRVADRTGVAVLAVAHTNKATQGDFIQRVGGSVGLTGAVRSAMLVARDPEKPEDDAARVLVHGKHNLSMPAPTRRFSVISATIETDPPISTAAIRWGEDAPHLTADDVLRGPTTERPTPKLDAAVGLLHEMLDAGAALRSLIEKAADERDISWRTVMSAKAELNVDDVQIPQPGVRGPGPSWWFFVDHDPREGVQGNGVQSPVSREIAHHSGGSESSASAGHGHAEANGLQGMQSPREASADHSAEHDCAHVAASEAFE